MNTINRVHFRVNGIPKPGGSKRAFYNKALGRAMVVDACKTNRQWRDSVIAAAVEAYHGAPMAGPLKVVFHFCLPRPKSHYGTGRNAGKVKPGKLEAQHTTRPDVLKLARSTEDALTGVLWRDDAQTYMLSAIKHYTAPYEVPGCWITVRGPR